MTHKVYEKIVDEIIKSGSADDLVVQKIFQRNPVSLGKMAKKSEILRYLRNELAQDAKKYDEATLKFLHGALQMKKTRTISGVTPVTVLTKPFPCPGKCIFCPTDVQMPKSYLSNEPGAQRAFSNKFDPYFQTFNRLVAYNNIGHPTDKIELIILGGTWSVYPKDYQVWFVKRCFDALNDFDPETCLDYLEPLCEDGEMATFEELFASQRVNESALSRCIGLVVETRPEFITLEETIRIRKLGATKVQMGIQSLDDLVLEKNKRGHTVGDTAEAFKLLRQAGFKIHGHWMPNLYGSDVSKDLEDYAKMFNDPALRPDELKIYPCSLIAGTPLMDYYKNGQWKPYLEEELLKVLVGVFEKTPEYCRITRVIRDIPSDDIVTGNKKTNFRQLVDEQLKKLGITPLEIRSREVRGFEVSLPDLHLKTTTYQTLVSCEVFLEYVTEGNKLAGFLRLSLPQVPNFIPELNGKSIIREIHVYGQSLGFGKKEMGLAQHIGLGKKLIEEAKRLSKDAGFNKMAVISSVGTRDYYRKNGFVDGEMYQTLLL